MTPVTARIGQDIIDFKFIVSQVTVGEVERLWRQRKAGYGHHCVDRMLGRRPDFFECPACQVYQNGSAAGPKRQTLSERCGGSCFKEGDIVQWTLSRGNGSGTRTG
jgi:hypothetical protein